MTDRDELIRRILDGSDSHEPVPAWVEAMADAIIELPLPSIPPGLAAGLRALPLRPPEKHTAQLIGDSREDQVAAPDPIGGRSRSRTLVYACPVEEVVLRVRPVSETTVEVEGQVIRPGRTPDAVRVVVVGEIGEEVALYSGDAAGGFRLPSLTRSPYRLSIIDDEAAVDLVLDLRDSP